MSRRIDNGKTRNENGEELSPQFNMQRQAILKYLKDIMILRTHYTADCQEELEMEKKREKEEERGGRDSISTQMR